VKNILEKYKIQLKLLLALSIGTVILTVIYYFLIPAILNYPKGTYATNFQVEVENTNYMSQVLSIAFAISAIFAIVTFWKTKFLIKYSDLLKNPYNYTIKEINYVRNKLFTTPYVIFALNVFIPSIALTVIHAYTIHQFSITTLKLFMLVVSLMTLFVTSIFIYTCNIFKKILVTLPHDNITGLKRATLKKRLFFNILPLILISVLFTSLLGYSMVSIKTGNSIFETYRNSLYYFKEYNTFSSVPDLLNKTHSLNLLNKNDFIFIKTEDNHYLNNKGEEIQVSTFFNKYLNEMASSNNGRVYEYYGIDCQGATIDITINGSTYILGIYFSILSVEVLFYFLLSFVILVLINVVILTLFSKSLSTDINIISDSFMSMIKNTNADVMQPLALTSNDEFGNLIISYNNIQELTKQHIQQLHDNQESLMEKERLASLGQLIGGIAHNLKTPIMSISGAAEGLTDLIKEYDNSIGDPEVNDQDHHDIAKDMSNWIAKIKTHTEYMSDVITAVKGQAVTLSNEEEITFTVGELLKRVNILMKHELKNAIIYLNISMKADENAIIHGDVNSLVQVINNMISNAIQAYNGKPEQNIDLIVEKEPSNNHLIISIQDYGSGIPKNVKDKLFKEMITTKGKNGTGLGLYMSYSTIRAHFNGNMTVESEEGKGTTFKIILPL
jgi:signal transduction histidine kinase